ncbi:cytochrome c oxidase subunit II [Chloroflexota bacterium]
MTGILMVLILLLPAAVGAQSGTQTGSLDATDISALFNIVLVMAVVVFLLVEGLLIFALVNYQRRSDDEMPEQVHGNNKMELGWTVGSALLVLVLFFFTLGFYQLPRAIPQDQDPLTIEVTGRMWQWEFRYPDEDVLVVQNGPSDDAFEALNVPAGRPVVLEITSADVQHSFWVPELAGKVDAIPGRVQRMWFQVDEPRDYIGQCAEYCGSVHYNMMLRVNVLPEEEFNTWLHDEAVAVAAAQVVDVLTLTGDPMAGEALYTAKGCNACHTLDESALVGPSYLGIGDRAGETFEGLSAQEYIYLSIIKPCDFVVDGFTCVMPQNYEEQLAPQDIADLMAFILEQ